MPPERRSITQQNLHRMKVTFWYIRGRQTHVIHQEIFIVVGCGNTAIASGGSGGTRSGGFKDRLVKYYSGMLQVELLVPQGEGWLT